MNQFLSTSNQNSNSPCCATPATTEVKNSKTVWSGLMKRWLFLLMVMGAIGANAQSVATYSFATSTGVSLDPMTGSTQLVASGSDDGISSVITIPFTFTYALTNYTQFSANANGLVRLGATAINTGASGYTNTAGNAGTNSPAIYPYWDDLATGSAAGGGKVHYVVTGSSPNRVLRIEWFVTVPISTGGAANARYQCWLFETSNVIQFVYGAVGANSGGYSIGLATSSTVFNNVITATNTNSTSAFTPGQTGVIATGRSYTFTPPAPPACPVPSNVTVTGASATTATVSWTGAATAIVEYGAPGCAAGTGATAGACGTVVSGSSPQTITVTLGSSYSIYVRQNCTGSGNGYSTNASVAYTQTAGESCQLADFVTVYPNSGAAVNTLLTTGLTADGPAGTCSDGTGNPNKKDRWVKFIAPSNGNKIIITTVAGTLTDCVMQVWSACPATGIALGCSDDVNSLMPELSFCQNQYVGGQTYYVQIWPYSATSTGNFSVKIYEAAPCPVPPANDECTGVVTLTVGAAGSCPASAVTGTTVNATATPGVSKTTCDAFGTYLDVFYKFNSGANTSLNFNFTNITGTNKFGIYTGCGTGVTAVCGTATTSTLITGVTANTDYYVIVYANSTATAGTFSLCISSPPVPACIPAPTSPANGGSLCNTGTVTLSFPASSGASGYDVYFDNVDGSTLVSANQPGLTYDAGNLPIGTYYWKVNPINASGTASGCIVWTFTVIASPAAGTISGPATLITGASGTYSETGGGGGTLQWKFATVTGGPYTTISGATNNPQNISFNTPGTYYVVLVHSATGCTDAISNEVTTVVSNPVLAGDFPCTPLTLSIGANGPFTNAGATGDAGEVVPPQTACNVQTGWCASSNSVVNSIWGTFVAPASGRVTIQAPGFDNQLALYAVTDCNDYGTYTLIAANDDGGTGINGGASNSALITAVCLTPGVTYYVKLDGYNAVTGSTNINVTEVPYTITASSGANGSISPTGVTQVGCNGSQLYEFTPATSCYSVDQVLVDGISVGAVSSYEFTGVSANHTISVSFFLTTSTITASSGANGTVTPVGPSTINCGANATYTITPNACYTIANVLVDGGSVGPVGTYTFTNVQLNHTISASFVLSTYTITATSGANGSVTPAGATSVNCGANATYTITPDACFTIADVLVDGNTVGAVGTYTFTNVQAGHTISATFNAVTPANAGTVSGASPLCSGQTSTYSSTGDAGGTWSSTVPGVATVNPTTGVVTAVAAGTTSITYTLTSACNPPVSSFQSLTVSPNANAGTVSGTTPLAVGANATYSSTGDAGGTWSSTNTGVASVNAASGVVTAVAAGTTDITYTVTNSCGTASAFQTLTVNANTYTITSSAGGNGTIAPLGATTVAEGANQTYTITPDACYHVDDVIVDGLSAGAVTSYTFTNVTDNHTISASFALNAPLALPVVTGPVNVCSYVGTGTPLTYTFNSPGATGYTYTIPPINVTLVSSTANSITLTFGSAFRLNGNKQIRVRALSPCGNSDLLVFVLVALAPPTPQPIVGTSSVCSVIGTSNTLTYTIPSVAGATSYIWTAQAGTTTITHPNGLGVNDTTVNVSFSNGFTSSIITVASANDTCGASNTRSFNLVKANPSTPGVISGSTNACAYMAPGGVPATYSVSAIAGNTYTWTVPANVTGLTGQGTNSISFTYPDDFVSGSVTVTATNGCGTSGSRSLSINKLLPSTPGVIDVIQEQPCPNRVFSYSLSKEPGQATSIVWTIPAGATILSGQGTISIMVSYPPTSFNSTVTVQGFSNCGSSTIRSTSVLLPTCAGERQVYSKGGAAITPATETMKVNVYPNPTVSDFKLQVVTAGKQTITVRILDAQGRSFKTFEVLPYQTINVGSDLKAGAYMMEVRQGNEVKVEKLLKF